MTLPAFPKIFALGDRHTTGIFDSEVEITEKIDGSAIAFGVINGELKIRSKGKELILGYVEKMFQAGVNTILNLRTLLPEGVLFYGEYLKSNKHNVLVYERIPKDHIILYAVDNQHLERVNKGTNGWEKHADIKCWGDHLGLEVVPVLYSGKFEGGFIDHLTGEKLVLSNQQLLDNLMDKESVLGKSKIEGLVIKNYNREVSIDHGNVILPIMMAKYVSKDFKEVHQKEWAAENTGKGRWEVYKSQFCNTARGHKAIQHLRDEGKLDYSPKDIGALLKEITQDIEAEEKENIKDWLWNEFSKEIFREATKLIPAWYKEYLVRNVDLGGC